jgi:hypothetical protein
VPHIKVYEAFRNITESQIHASTDNGQVRQLS